MQIEFFSKCLFDQGLQIGVVSYRGLSKVLNNFSYFLDNLIKIFIQLWYFNFNLYIDFGIFTLKVVILIFFDFYREQKKS